MAIAVNVGVIVNVATAPAVRDLQHAGSSRFIRTFPALGALAYPGLIWCGPAISPLFLATAMIVPFLGLLIGHRLDHHLYPRSRWIAFAVVATPPLYVFLRGWLDFQRIVPFKGLHVWIVVWLAFASLAFWERLAYAPPLGSQRAPQPRLALAHGISAVLITVFAAAHLLNHFSGLWGGERHTAIMNALRLVYRMQVVETALLASIAFQIISGLLLLKRKLPQTVRWIDELQAAAGIYLALFFLSHLSAVFRARLVRDTDTNWVWLTADSLLTDPWSARLAPYYFLSVIALGIHGGAGIRHVMLSHGRSMQFADKSFYVAVAAAAALSTAIMAALIRG
jgi:succinate dehydrogenase/fumarate reductase cytochrome b subunit